jgi:hypothetical protein
MVQEQRQDLDKLDALHVLAKSDQNFVVLTHRYQIHVAVVYWYICI